MRGAGPSCASREWPGTDPSQGAHDGQDVAAALNVLDRGAGLEQFGEERQDVGSIRAFGLVERGRNWHFNAMAISCRRLAPVRFDPSSNFWICWKVMPTATPSSVQLGPLALRRVLPRTPTVWSMSEEDLPAIRLFSSLVH